MGGVQLIIRKERISAALAGVFCVAKMRAVRRDHCLLIVRLLAGFRPQFSGVVSGFVPFHKGVVVGDTVVKVDIRLQIAIDLSAIAMVSVAVLKKTHFSGNSIVRDQSAASHGNGVLHQHPHYAAAVDIAMLGNIAIQLDITILNGHKARGIGAAHKLEIHGRVVCIYADQGHIGFTPYDIAYAIAGQAPKPIHTVISPQFQSPGNGAIRNGAVHAVARNGARQTGLG